MIKKWSSILCACLKVLSIHFQMFFHYLESLHGYIVLSILNSDVKIWRTFLSCTMRATNILLRGMEYCARKLLCSNHSPRKTYENLILNSRFISINLHTNFLCSCFIFSFPLFCWGKPIFKKKHCWVGGRGREWVISLSVRGDDKYLWRIFLRGMCKNV